MNAKPDLRIVAWAVPLLLGGAFAWAQKPDPFFNQPPGPGGGAVTERGAGPPRQASAQMEWISLSPAAARLALIKYPDGAALYRHLQEELDKAGEGQPGEVVMERIEVIRGMERDRSKAEAVLELAYPTEFSEPSIPQAVGLGIGAPAAPALPAATTPNPPVPGRVPASPDAERAVPGARGEAGAGGGTGFAAESVDGLAPDFLKTSAIPQSYEFKNLGWTSELEFVPTDSPLHVELNYASTYIRYLRKITWDPDNRISQPVFATQQKTGRVKVRVGQPALLGTMSPLSGQETPEDRMESRVWLYFVTVTLLP